MKQRLFNLAAMVSLLLFVSTTVLWVRGYWVADEIQRFDERVLPDGNGRRLVTAFHSARGRLRWVEYRYARPQVYFSPAPVTSWSHKASDAGWQGAAGQWINSLGFGFGSDRKTPTPTATVVWRYAWVPCWFVLLLTAPLPAVRIIGYLRRRSFGPGQCNACGYDLRATPDRCPECGRAADAGQA